MEDNKFYWNNFVKEVGEWSITNFGNQDAIYPFIGLIEEIGELVEAKNINDIHDSMGDCMIYLGDFIYRHGNIKIDELFEEKLEYTFKDILISIGHACHAVLKSKQNIRTNEDHLVELKKALKYMVSTIRSYGTEDISVITLKTWEIVKKRNWTKNKKNGLS